jgi:hypothetical protein
MKYSNKTILKFYQLLGKLFYAAAAIDKTVRREELEALRKSVKTEWLNLDESFDEFETDSAYQIEIVFDWLNDKHPDPGKAIHSLQIFRQKYPDLFTEKVKAMIMKTASAISSSFAAKNKSELVFLSRLERALEEKESHKTLVLK